MEQIDVTLKWYKDLIPSVRGLLVYCVYRGLSIFPDGCFKVMFVLLSQVFFPHSQTLIGLLQALDVANRLEMVPQIWKG